MRAICFGLMTVLALLLGAASPAQLPAGEPAISVALVPESRSVAPGQTVTLAFVMRPKPGWHGYWQNPGDAGTPDRVAWRLPPGSAVGPLLYPVPQRLTIAGLMNYVYERDYALLADLRVPKDEAPGTSLPVRATLDYLACTDEVCVPQKSAVATELRVGGAADAGARASFDRYRSALPRPLGSQARFDIARGQFRMAVPMPSALPVAGAYFFPLTDGALDYSAAQSFSREGDLLILETKAEAGTPAAVEGVLALGDGTGLQLAAAPGAVPAAGEPLAQASAAGSILAALLGAFLGGLILNIMPCVFPILSLKALSLANAGGDERSARREALAYAAGIILVCLALGAAVLTLRASGAAVGWAFHLQDPRVILLLLLLVTAIALNLAGLFELPALAGGERLARSGGTRGAFWTGALAAFVATPCTGPLMGAALGAALILPAAAALAVFAGLGFGLAFPFLLLGFVPALRRRLPKPGAWMATFQRILSVPMFVTALGLAWILGRQSGVNGMALGLAAALALGLALWWLGRRAGRAWLPLGAAAAAAAAALWLVPTLGAAPAYAGAAGLLPSEPFSEARLAALRSERRPVFVYFTADWCLTCKVNEEAALDRREVAEAFEDAGVAVLVGDWTRADPAIGRFLASHGRSGVPLYLYYPPGGEPQVLPQILTPGRLAGLTRT